jgi:hypothetical protein
VTARSFTGFIGERNVKLNEELSIRIYSFPMRYQPTDLPVRSHIGAHWNRYFLRSVQLVLQATHGVVSGEPEFYKAAFGSTHEEFEEILSRPHHMIFNRHWYERYDGRGELEDYRSRMRRLSASERTELIAFLSARNPAEYANDLRELPPNVRSAAHFYVPLARDAESEIRRTRRAQIKAAPSLPSEEIVEDAGLEDDEPARPQLERRRKRGREAA